MTWTIRVRQWSEFQHYTDRDPPWIKLHRRTLIEKREWRELPGSAAKLLIDLWMLAGYQRGEIAMSVADLAWRLRSDEAQVRANLQLLASAEFIELAPVSASRMEQRAPEVEQGAFPEGEVERETEIEREPKALVALRATPDLPMASVERETATRKTREAALHLGAQVVFTYWRAKMGKTVRSLLDPKRETRLISRLRENGGDVSELLYAVDGATRDEFLMGRDDRAARPYNGIETIFRDRAQVERLVALVKQRQEQHPFLAENGEGHHAT